MKKVAVLLLAAGKSSRMGFPKQLLAWGGKPLLQYQIDRICRLSVHEVIVVLGHEAEIIQRKIMSDCSKVTFLVCESYREGLSESLKFGLSYIESKYDGVLIMLADLPLVRLQTMQAIVEMGTSLLLKGEKHPYSVQPIHNKEVGHPVYIGNVSGLEWDQLSGDIGAKPLLKQLKRKHLIETDDSGILFDIDTPESYENALECNRKLFLKR